MVCNLLQIPKNTFVQREERTVRVNFTRICVTVVITGIFLLGIVDASLAFAEQEKQQERPKVKNYSVTAANSEIKVDGNLD